jgi:hypothetical protein
MGRMPLGRVGQPGPGRAEVGVRERWPVGAVAGTVVAAILLPVLGRGFLLSYDMVFVPRQPLDRDAIGLGTALPRAVPVDAVVAVASRLVRGDVLQQLALAAILVLACVGAARVVPAGAPLTRCVAGAVYAWNPYVAERLVHGHWALLLGYALLPFVLSAAAGMRAGRSGATARAVLALGGAALTPTGGLLAAALAGAVVGWPGRPRRAADLARVLLAAAVLNAPWWLPGLLHPAVGRSDPAGVAAFAARPDTWAGTVGSLLGLGGIWNAEVVPASRGWLLAPALSALLVAALAAGWPLLRDRLHSDVAGAVAAVAVGGLALALAGSVGPGADILRWAVQHLPGAGLLRDGQKFVAPFALLTALGAALGVERLIGWLTLRLPAPPRLAAGGAAGAALLLPFLITPDLAWGAAGRLHGVRYPPDWQAVHSTLAGSAEPGAVLALPYHTFRAFGWNGNRTVLDPAPRYFPRPVVVADTLPVGGRPIHGEDLHARAVGAALARGEPLGRFGIGWLLVEHGTAGTVPATTLAAAELRYDGPDLSLYRVRGPVARPPPGPPAAPVLLADGAAIALLVGALAVLAWVGARAGTTPAWRHRNPPGPLPRC